MKKFLSLVLLVLCILAPLSATWNVGNYVDSFGDPSGEHFIYTIADNGTMSNTATRRSEAKVRICLDIDEKGRPDFNIECHDYDWSNPVDSNILDYMSYWKFKNDRGEVLELTGSSYKWNRLSSGKAKALLSFILDAENIRAYVSLGSSTYSFSFEKDNLEQVIEDLLTSINAEEKTYDKVFNNSGSNGFLDFDHDCDISLRTYGVGATTRLENSGISTSFAGGLSFDFDAFIGNHGAVTSYAFYKNNNDNYFDVNIGYGYRTKLNDKFDLICKIYGVFSLKSYPYVSEYVSYNKIDMVWGLRAALDFNYYINNDFYIVTGIADRYMFNPILAYEPEEEINLNVLEAIIGFGYAFDI